MKDNLCDGQEYSSMKDNLCDGQEYSSLPTSLQRGRSQTPQNYCLLAEGLNANLLASPGPDFSFVARDEQEQQFAVSPALNQARWSNGSSHRQSDPFENFDPSAEAENSPFRLGVKNSSSGIQGGLEPRCGVVDPTALCTSALPLLRMLQVPRYKRNQHGLAAEKSSGLLARHRSPDRTRCWQRSRREGL